MFVSQYTTHPGDDLSFLPCLVATRHYI
uniref:Uncharacterized protein n=1 Tax=Rhizophora mucronata TaxID=61149 RepID=A0A2P2R0A7_RHIMU